MQRAKAEANSSVPAITVLMPVYNSGRFLREAMDSLLAQTFADFELLIMDNASTDDTPAVIASYRDARIRYVRNEANLGLPASLNRGLKLARAPLIARMDADDQARPHRLAWQYRFMSRHPDVGVCGGQIIKIVNGVGYRVRYPLRHEENRITSLFHSCFPHPAVMLRRDVLERNNLSYRENLKQGLEDYDLWSRLVEVTQTVNLDRVVLDYRCHAQQLSAENSKAVLVDRREIYRRVLSRLWPEVSEEELDIHARVSIFHEYFDPQLLARAEQWLIRLVEANARVNLYEPSLFRQMLAKRWAVLCGQSETLGSRTFTRFWRSSLARGGRASRATGKLLLKSVLARHQSGDGSWRPMNQKPQALKRGASSPCVTVLMTMYNARAFLTEAVESILGQSFRDFEFLVVDDGSTDNSGDLLASYGDSRIRYIRNERNMGQPASLNRGILLARGRYIARMDADDIARPHRLQRQVTFMDQHSEVGICGGQIRKFASGPGRLVRYPLRQEEIRVVSLFHSGFPHPGVMLRREVLLQHQLYYDETMNSSVEDYDLWSRLVELTGSANLSCEVLDYRCHPGQMSVGYTQRLAWARKHIHRRVVGRLIPEVTDEELDLHGRVSYLHEEFDANLLEQAEQWLLRLLEANDRRALYDGAVMRLMFAQRWAVLCGQVAPAGLASLRRYSRSPLSRGHHMDYLAAKLAVKTVLKRRSR